MSALNLLSPKGLGELARQVTPQTLYAFDLDGTLAPIAVHACEVRLDPALSASLQRLDELGHVCVLTGRSREDAIAILGPGLRMVIGNHGCEWPSGIRPRNLDFIETCLAWKDRLASEFADEPGIELEYKGETLALHYRRAKDPTAALERIEEAIRHLAPAPRVIGGKFVVNLLPMAAETKGIALVEAMTMLGAQKAIFLGDDVTDEEVFQLENVDLLGVHIGSEAWTAASYYLDDQSQVAQLLASMVEMLEEQIRPPT
jgi:trehalose 6-phosphate phosphatase